MTFGDLIYSKTFEYSKYHPYSVQLIKSDDIGNIVYGAVFYSINLSLLTALAGAGGYQIFDEFHKEKYKNFIKSLSAIDNDLSPIEASRNIVLNEMLGLNPLDRFTFGDDPKDSRAISYGYYNFKK